MLKVGWKGLAMIVLALAVLTALFAPRIVVVDPQPVFQEIVTRR